MTFLFKNLFLLISILFLFVSCSDKVNALRYFKNSSETINSIPNTKKIDLNSENQNEISVIVTYLNNTDEEYRSKDVESFLVAIQIFNNVNLFKDNIKLLLNNEEPISFEKVDKDSKLIKNISLKNHWADHYLVKFEAKSKIKRLNLKVINKKSGIKTIIFEK